MSLPKLNRQPIRPEMETDAEDKEVWKPTWRCFCCQDTGTVRPLLASLVIPDYDFSRDLSVVCQNPRCIAGTDYRSNDNYDQRFTAGICSELDKINREDWRRKVESQFAGFQKRIQDAAKDRNLRMRSRTNEEQQIAKQRHTAVLDSCFSPQRELCTSDIKGAIA
jgi:hypothetical protein